MVGEVVEVSVGRSSPFVLLWPAVAARGGASGVLWSVFGGSVAGGLLLRRLCSGRPRWRGEQLLPELGRCGWWTLKASGRLGVGWS